jgi:hypothetical protein
VILRCTAKLLHLLGATPESVTVVSDGDWYANLLWIERRKCILLTHPGTLFSVFVPNVRKADLIRLGSLAVSAIEGALAAEGLGIDALGHLDPDNARLAATASRSVLGFMNDMAYVIDCAVAETGLHACNMASVNHALQRHLHRTGAGEGGYERPIDAARTWASAAPSLGHG